jgi:hypothetical protein
VDHTVFDYTSVLKMIESVFDVEPLAARETSNDVGNLLSVINLNNPPRPAPALPQPLPVTPQTICTISIISTQFRSDDEHRGFQRLERAARQRGWPVYD